MVLRAQAIGELPAELALFVVDNELAFRPIEKAGPQMLRAEAAE